MDKGFKIPDASSKTAFLIEKGVGAEKLASIMSEAQELRKRGETVLIARMAKNRKFQKDNLERSGYTSFKDYYRD